MVRKQDDRREKKFKIARCTAGTLDAQHRLGIPPVVATPERSVFRPMTPLFPKLLVGTGQDRLSVTETGDLEFEPSQLLLTAEALVPVLVAEQLAEAEQVPAAVGDEQRLALTREDRDLTGAVAGHVDDVQPSG